MADPRETRGVERTMEDAEREKREDEAREGQGAQDGNARPGLLSGEPFIPPVAAVGPGIGGGMGAATGTVAGGLPLPVVPVVKEDGPSSVDTGVVVNPFTPAEPANDRPFEAVTLSPEDLASRVESELAADGRLSTADISVVCEEGMIRLDGTAPTPDVAADVASIVSRMPGVRGVINNLRPR